MLPSIANSLAHAITDKLSESQELTEKKHELKQEIARIREQRQLASQQHQQEIKKQHQHINLLYHQMDTARKQELPMHRYASELKDSNTPSHILVLQAQVCKAVHYMSVDSVQLQLLENMKEELRVLAKEQQRQQLKNLLWTVESKTELRQQQEDEIYDQAIASNSEEESLLRSSEIDDLLNNLELLKLNNPTSPNVSIDDWEQVLSDDIEKNGGNYDDFDLLFDDDEEEEFHKSLPTIHEGGLSEEEKKNRAVSLIQTGTWNSEKPQVAW